MPAKTVPRLSLYNTLTRKKEFFKPLKGNEVRMYTCGPTVYDYAHIGNMRAYLFEDLLRMVIEFSGYKVVHVMNITDVGHLTSDADTGEDKMEVGAKRENKTAWQIADFYTKSFLQDMERLHIKHPSILCKATDHIKEMIGLISALEKKGYTYALKDGIYFNTTRLRDYGKLAGLRKEDLKAGARVEMVQGKKNPTDFALWKLSPAGAKRQMEWQSPWGVGFPGWHIECSAMSMKYLGTTFDIHCGGVDHIAVHHTNEIAQSEAATGKKFVNVWLHGEFMLVDGKKMAKSLGNFYKLQDLVDKGFDPLAFRYLCLSTHYRSQLNFTLEALEKAQNTLRNINDFYLRLKDAIRASKKNTKDKKTLGKLKRASAELDSCLLDDLNTPEALSRLFSMIHLVNKMMEEKKTDSASMKFTHGYMLKINGIFQFLRKTEELAEAEKKLIKEREKARKTGDYRKSDEIRGKLKKMGIIIEDTPQGPRWKKIKK